jgi:hypothetical protein
LGKKNASEIDFTFPSYTVSKFKTDCLRSPIREIHSTSSPIDPWIQSRETEACRWNSRWETEASAVSPPGPWRPAAVEVEQARDEEDHREDDDDEEHRRADLASAGLILPPPLPELCGGCGGGGGGAAG